MTLQNNAHVSSGADIAINVSSLTLNEPVFCVLASDGNWSNEVLICDSTPPESCTNPHNSYKGRVRYVNPSCLQIQDVRPEESGIYQCRTKFTPSSFLISGVIVVGRLSCCLFVKFN